MATNLRQVLSSWPVFAAAAVLLIGGGVLRLASRPHGIPLALGVIFIVLGVSNAVNAVRAYRRQNDSR